MPSVLDTVTAAMADSELAAAVAAIATDSPSRLHGETVRALSDEEIALLEAQGNRADDWSAVAVAAGFTAGHVWNNRFLGRVVLGRFSGEPRDLGDGASLPSGVSDSTLQDAEVGDEAVVSRVGLLSGTLVGHAAAVVNSDSVTGGGSTTFGCGRELALGIETGGRDVRVYAEITVGVAGALCARRDDDALQDGYAAKLGEYLDRVNAECTFIGSGAVVRDTNRLSDSYIGPGARVSGARLVAGSCLLSSPEEPAVVAGGAWVNNSILQWGAEVDSLALVDASVLCEHSHVERHGKLTESILGPNSGVGEGEVTASLVGPFVGFHHQSLLIAAIWPEGKGNVGYGANIGSNHTGKAPDQEIWCGEGTFFGLGANIKFPSDFTRSPYSVIASGVTCLPQRIEFPFSLINSPSQTLPDISPALNEMFPGWVLLHNIYMIKRNEGKYRQRNKARREEFEFDVFRPETVRLMQVALERLLATPTLDFYTGHDIEGLGKNYTSRSAVDGGVKAYSFYIEWYALRGLKQRLEASGLAARSPEADALMSEPSDDPRWEQQRQILGDRSDVAGLLADLQDRERTIARNVEGSKSKDDQRGIRIIDDYATAHSPASEDGFVKETWEEFERISAEIDSLLV